MRENHLASDALWNDADRFQSDDAEPPELVHCASPICFNKFLPADGIETSWGEFACDDDCAEAAKRWLMDLGMIEKIADVGEGKERT